MDELLKRLAVLHDKSEAAAKAVKAEEDRTERKLKVAELSAISKDITSLTEEIEEMKAEDAALAVNAGYEAPGQPLTRQTGALNNSTVVVGQDNIIDDPNLGFINYGDCAQAVHNASVNGVFDPRLNVIGNNNPALQAAGLRQNSGPEGGFLVPPGFRMAELETAGMSLDLYSEARGFTLGQEESITIPAVDETSRKDGSRWGGVNHQWLEEEETLEESNPTFRQITLRPKEIAVFVKVNDKLLRNSPVALGQFLNMASTDELRFALSDALMNGNGVGRPKGIFKSGALVTVLKKSGQAADTVVIENTTAMKARFTRRWLTGAKWYINRDVMAQIEVLKIGDTPVFIREGTVAGQSFSTLHGMEIVETEYNEVLGDKGDILLANLQAYLTAQRTGGIRSDTSIHFNFDQLKTAFRFVTEADGQTWANNALIDFKGSGTTSPYVTLEERT